MVHRFITLLIMVSSLLSSSLARAITKPDFAFPKQVEAAALAVLDSGKATGDETIASLINYSVAVTSTDTDSTSAVIGMAEKVIAGTDDAATKAMGRILLADLYASIYSDSRYKYDRRELTAEPSDDYREWSGKQFRNRIMTLVDSALSASAALKTVPLDKWPVSVKADRHTLEFYPTLYDFVANKAIALTKSISYISDSFPNGWFCNADDFTHLDFRYVSSEARLILDLYRDLLEFHAGDAAPFIITDIDRLEFVGQRISSENPEETEHERYLQFYNLYKQFSSVQYSTEALLAIGITSPENADAAEYYAAATGCLSAHGSYFRANNLRNIVNLLKEPSLQVAYNRYVVPGKPLKLTVTNNNCQRYELHVYRIPETESSAKISTAYPKPVTKIARICHDKVPYSNKTVDSVVINAPGTYIVVPVINGRTDRSRYYDIVRATELAVTTQANDTSTFALIFNPLTGEPRKSDATIHLTFKNKQTGTLQVSPEGMTLLPSDVSSLYVTSGNDRSYTTRNICRLSAQDPKVHYAAQIFTDRAIYHHGDTVQWSAVVQSYAIDQPNAPAPNKKLTVMLYDANFQPIDTVETITDDWGRCSGAFNLPTEGLTGEFSIRLTDSPTSPYLATSKSFMVSDYKLPTYLLEINSVKTDLPASGAVTVEGRAITYSGFPLAGCNVNVTLSGVGRIWWRSEKRAYYSTAVTTGDDGRFTITLPAALLATSPISGNMYEIQLTSTSTTGENQSASKIFTTGKPYNIHADIPHNIDVSQPVKLRVSLTDMNGDKAEQPVRYEVIQNDTIIRSGIISAEGLINLSRVPSGTYTITCQTADPDLSYKAVFNDINLYRPDDKLPPVTDTPLWIPKGSVSIKPGEQAKILYGVSDTTWILYTLSSPTRIIEQKWINVGAGIHTLECEVPEDIQSATVFMSAMRDYKWECRALSVTRENPLSDIKINIESFRDKVIPGDKETWKFKITDGTGNGVQSAVILDMYNKALESLVPHHLSIFRPDNHGIRYRILYVSGYGTSNVYYSLGNKWLKEAVLQAPKLNTWGYPLYNGMRITERKMFMSAAGARSVNAAADMATASLSESAVMKADFAAETAEEEAADADSGNGTVSGETLTDDGFTYRDGEVPLAFFRPMLTTDADGNLEFSFTVPDANTTWILQGASYTKAMWPASISKEVIAAKPVMVQPNLPRYLNTGDRAELAASVMNATDSSIIALTTVEIFSPVDLRIISKHSYTDTIAAGQAAVVTATVDVPDGIDMIGYRIRSSAGRHTDGEQSIIPVMPATERVIETLPFYINAGTQDFSLKLPDIKKDATVTLQYCNNPVWYVATALPGLRESKLKDALSASSSIFSAAVAEGILRDNPAIAEALRHWTATSQTDSVLTSMLERNPDLKTMLLTSTPWVSDALSQTERMSRLALLFDSAMISDTYSKATVSLTSMECTGGGWAWAPCIKEPSRWTTINILAMLGQLDRMGYLPDNKELRTMASRAVTWLDRKAAERIERDAKATDVDYLLVRDLYSDIAVPQAAQRLATNTVNMLRNDWKKLQLPMKAVAAIVLDRHGDKVTPGIILSSLKEFATVTPEKGMWWPSLDDLTVWSQGKISATSIILQAFNTVDPKSSDIDLIRQWLILQKEAKDWGSSIATTEAIYSILSSGSNWNGEAEMPELKIGRRKINVTPDDKLLGSFRSDISKLNPSGSSLTVKNHGSVPSWGAVYIQYSSELGDIKASGCDDITIEKALYKRINSADGVKWVAADTLTVGDVVQVNLTVTTRRDMDYVAITDNRGACFEPVEQLPAPIVAEGIRFYRENRDECTNMFITHLPKGVYRLSYELNVNNAGTYSAGTASIQSQYAPALSAHSAGAIITVSD